MESTHVPCITRQILNHRTTREVLSACFLRNRYLHYTQHTHWPFILITNFIFTENSVCVYVCVFNETVCYETRILWGLSDLVLFLFLNWHEQRLVPQVLVECVCNLFFSKQKHTTIDGKSPKIKHRLSVHGTIQTLNWGYLSYNIPAFQKSGPRIPRLTKRQPTDLITQKIITSEQWKKPSTKLKRQLTNRNICNIYNKQRICI